MTLDDAAEQGIRNVAEALRTQFGLTADQMNVLGPALWVIHDKATEAAAKKCEAVYADGARSHDDCYDACNRCAAAIRGKE